jgi:hypothetical protein
VTSCRLGSVPVATAGKLAEIDFRTDLKGGDIDLVVRCNIPELQYADVLPHMSGCRVALSTGASAQEEEQQLQWGWRRNDKQSSGMSKGIVTAAAGPAGASLNLVRSGRAGSSTGVEGGSRRQWGSG